MNKKQTQWFIERLTGSCDTVVDWRLIHDKDKGCNGKNLRGSIDEIYDTLVAYNSIGWGIFCNINQMGAQSVRAQFVDLDNTLTSDAMYHQATSEGACIAVQSSPNKYHIYWFIQPYNDNTRFTTLQRKLIQTYDGDKSIIDVTRVMRVPGFYHLKNQPVLVQGWDLPNAGNRYTIEQMEDGYKNINVISHTMNRKPLGDVDMQAPSMDLLKLALNLLNPNELARDEWLSISAAFKQSGWNHTDDVTLFNIWSQWCESYERNDSSENRKLWDSIKDTETGWKTFQSRTPVKAYEKFNAVAPLPKPTVNDTPSTKHTSQYGEILSAGECETYFDSCYWITSMSRIVDKNGRFMNATAFNGLYGGKQFIISSVGKLTDEAWKAATRSTVWTVPKVDHTRFLPQEKPFSIVKDAMRRDGLNVYIPATIDSREGDVSLWLDLLSKILPDESDRKLYCDYMAHCVKYPGVKIQYAPLLQSAEGIGKSVFFEVMQHALGDMYVYSPKAPELVKSGSTFNAWQRGKLLIVVNEIKIDERRELIEILKPMITDGRIEVQSKGVDQEMEDNAANWLFFSNYKDAIPINKGSRRYAIFYSALQSEQDILNAGMDKTYFNRLFRWLRKEGGLQAITHWLMNYPIECEAVPVRAPFTSSYQEALQITRSPMEVLIAECVDDGLQGFKGGYVSNLAVLKRCKSAGIHRANSRAVQTCLENMGYVKLGRSVCPYIQEDVENRADIYGTASNLALETYGRVQGYE